MRKKVMSVKEAVSWMKQPGIKAMMPCDPQSQEAMKVLLNFVDKELEAKKSKKAKASSFRIYYSSAAGLDYTGITVHSEAEAKELCAKYNEQDDNPYGHHTYKPA